MISSCRLLTRPNATKSPSIHCQSSSIENNIAGIAFIDISTGEFLVAQGKHDYIEKLLQNFRPSEVIFQKSHRKD
ncbi:MAG: hypothetical protein ACKN89_10245, partial [Cyanobium sp.]